jgi:hypothetical protein
VTSALDSVRDFLATGPLAHIVTLGPDGTRHVSLAWAGFDGAVIHVAVETIYGTGPWREDQTQT